MGKISARTSATTIDGTETIGIIQTTDKKSTLALIFSKIGIILGGLGGNTRGTNAVDFQFIRTNEANVAAATGSFIGGGADNKVATVVKTAKDGMYSHAEGYQNKSLDWYGHVEGAACINDGKIAHTEGNNSTCSANDSHAEGNRTIAGRMYFPATTAGSEDAGDSLGVLPFILIPSAEGDVTSMFPNLLTDNVTTRYGAGAQMDAKGNIYTSGNTPATWVGDVPTVPHDLTWALHSVAIIRGPNEGDTTFIDIAKATYTAGVGTKVYYFGTAPYATFMGIYSSYAPQVLINGLYTGGNGQHSEGYFTSTYGYGTHAEGYYTRAFGSYSHAEGQSSKATGQASHAEGQLTVASGLASHAEGVNSVSSGNYSHAESGGISSGLYSHAERGGTASGAYSNASGFGCVASGDYSIAKGKEAVASRTSQEAFSAGKFSVAGDSQGTREHLKITAAGVGWHDLRLLIPDYGKSYAAETLLVGRQFSTTNGMAGESCMYKFKWGVDRGAKMDFATTDVDVDANQITVTEKIKTNTPLLFTTTGTIPGGLSIQAILYAIYVDDTHIQLSNTISGSAIDITNQGSGTHSYSLFHLMTTTKELIGRSFVDDGDTVGDGLTTGIRADFHTTYFSLGAVRLKIDGIATRSLRWTAITDYAEVM